MMLPFSPVTVPAALWEQNGGVIPSFDGGDEAMQCFLVFTWADGNSIPNKKAFLLGIEFSSFDYIGKKIDDEV